MREVEVTGNRARGMGAPDAVERALAAAIGDSTRIGDLLAELSRGRLWLPLPDDGSPVTDGSAVTLPTVTYLGSEFVPAFTSAARLHGWVPQPRLPEGRAPHIVVPAAELARLLPPDVGIALNPGAGASIPVYPEGVAWLAAAAPPQPSPAGQPGPDSRIRIHVGPPPAQPGALLPAIAGALAAVPQLRRASAAWLRVELSGEGLVIAAELDDPADAAAQDAVISAVQAAALTVPAGPGFPLDVAFPGEADPDELDDAIASGAVAFYSRQAGPAAGAFGVSP